MENKQPTVADLEAIIAEHETTIAELTAEIEALRPAAAVIVVPGEWAIEHETPEGKAKSKVRVANGMDKVLINVEGFPRCTAPTAQLFDLATGKVPKALDPALEWAVEGKKANGKALELVQYYLAIGAGWLIVEPA